jgi:hypothetical protein
MQRLFATARWDAGGVRDDLRGLAAAGVPEGTGFRTKPQLL